MFFVPNPNLAEDLIGDPDVREGLTEAAEEAKPLVEQELQGIGAPWMPRAGHELLEVESDEEGVYLVNTDWAAHLMEFGSVKNPVHAPLRRGAAAAGLRVEESPKP